MNPIERQRVTPPQNLRILTKNEAGFLGLWFGDSAEGWAVAEDGLDDWRSA